MTSTHVATPPSTCGVLYGHPIVGRELKWLDRSSPSPFPPIRVDVADTSSLSTLCGKRPWVEPTSRREPDGTLVVDSCEFGAFVLDPNTGRVTAPRYGSGTAFWERRLLNWAIPILVSELGKIVLHAAGIVTPRGAVLVVGESTAGKSTFAAAALERGYQLLSEDGVALTRTEAGEGFLAWPGPSGMRLRHRRDGSRSAQRTKAIRPEGRCSTPVPLAGVVLLRSRTAEGMPVERLGAAASVATLANHSFLHGNALSAMYPELLAVARSLPVMATSLRDGLEFLPSEVDRVLASVAARLTVSAHSAGHLTTSEGGET